MTTPRRIGSEAAENRARLIDAAAWVMCAEGYAAVTARRVAAKAELKLPLVYYYFHTMDDLILAVVRKNIARRLDRFELVANSSEPLRALWELNTDASGAIMSELMALANHNPAIKAEMVTASKHYRGLQIRAVERLLMERGIDPDVYPPAGVVMTFAAMARAIVQDSVLGAAGGYEDAMMLVERALVFFGGEARPDMPRSDSLTLPNSES